MKKVPIFETAEIICPNDRVIPDMIKKCAQFFYVSNGDIRLRVMLATAPVDDPRGTIIYCPGRTEFIEKYFETIEDFLTRGFTVLMLDPRGQGLSSRLLPDPVKSHVKNFQEYADDLAFVAEQFSPHLPKPHIVMGHSMGGCVALQAIILGLINPSAVICSAPMLGLFNVETSMAGYFIRTASRLGFANRSLPGQKQDRGMPVPFQGNKLSSDKVRFEAWAEYFKTTPALRVGPPTFAWAAAGIRAMSYVNRNAAQLKIPGLIVAAGGDPIVDPASNQRFAENAGILYRVVPGAMHEMFLEKDEYREQFLSAIDEFLDMQKL